MKITRIYCAVTLGLALLFSCVSAFAEPAAAGQQAVGVLAFIACRLAHFVEDAASLLSVRLGVCPTSSTYVLACCLA